MASSARRLRFLLGSMAGVASSSAKMHARLPQSASEGNWSLSPLRMRVQRQSQGEGGGARVAAMREKSRPAGTPAPTA